MPLIDPTTRKAILDALGKKDKGVFKKADFIRKMPEGEVKIGSFKRTLTPTQQKEFNGKLMESIAKGDIEGLAIALRNGADIEAKNGPEGITPLIAAVKFGKPEVVKLLLVNGADVDAPGGRFLGPFSFTPLMAAVAWNKKDIVEILIDNFAAIDQKNPNGELTALMVATLYANDAMVNFLIDNNAQLDIVDAHNETAVYFAARDGNTDCLKALLEKGANPHICDKKAQTPLMMAVKRGKMDAIDLLIIHYANPNAEDETGNTAVMYTDDFSIINHLVAGGADINHPNKEGMTPLFAACRDGRAQRAEALVGNGAKPDVGDRSALVLCLNGRTTGVWSPDHEKTAMMLIEKGANVDARDGEGNTPLMMAIELGSTKVRKCLMDKGAVLTATDKKGETALMKLSKKGGIADFDFLLMATITELPRRKMILGQKDINGWTALTHAAASGSTAAGINTETGVVGTTAAFLLGAYRACGLDTNDGEGNTPLMIATKHNQIGVVSDLISSLKKPEIDAENNKGETALMMATVQKGTNAVSVLLTHGADVNHENKDKRTALICAAEHGYYLNTDYLLKHNAKPDAQSNDGMSAILLAAKNGHTDVVETLLGAGADMNQTATPPVGPHIVGPNAMMLAAGNGHAKVVRLLLLKGMKQESKDGNGWSTLMYAAKSGDVSCINLLIGQLKNETGPGCTSLDIAAQNDRPEAIIALIRAGADVNRANSNNGGNTPLFYAGNNNACKAIRVLVENGARIEQTDLEGGTPLTDAITFGKTDAAKTLIEIGADVNAKKKYMNALMLATERNQLEIAKLLLEKGAKVDRTATIFYVTPLMKAAEEDHPEMAILLRKHGANANARDGQGNTPLMIAAERGHDKVISGLISDVPGAKKGKKANIHARNSEKKTALMIAAANGHTASVKALVIAGAKPHARQGRTIGSFAEAWVAKISALVPWPATMIGMMGGALGLIAGVFLTIGVSYNAIQLWSSESFAKMIDHRYMSSGDWQVVAVLTSLGIGGFTLAAIAKAINKSLWSELSEEKAIGETAVMMAAAKGSTETTEFLLSQPGDPYKKAKDGSTLLMKAAEGDGKTIAKVCENPNRAISQDERDIRDKTGWTAAMHAAAMGKGECLDYLLANGATLDTSKDGTDWDDAGGLFDKIVGPLTKIYRVIVPDSWMVGSPSAEPDGKKLLKDLLKLDGGYKWKYKDGEKLLIERGVDPNTRTWWGRVPLSSAVRYGDAEMAGFMIEKGARIEPKHVIDAAGIGDINLVRLLVEKGGKVEKKAWARAEKNGHIEVAKFLYGKWSDGSQK